MRESTLPGMQVFFFEAFEEEEAELRSFLPKSVSAGFSWKAIQEYGATEAPAPIISIRTQSIIPVQWQHGIKAVLSRSAGYDHLIRFADACEIKPALGYLPMYCVRAVAEQAMLLWMALLRRFRRQTEQFARFHRDGLTGAECAGKRLLVVGVGNIGHEILLIGRALGMETKGVDIVKKHGDVAYTSIEEGLAWADVIVCSMNLTKENHGYFSYDRLGLAKKGAIFVNIARGEFSPPEAMLRLLDEGRLSGIGLDVYDQEQEMAVALRAGKKSDSPVVAAALTLASRPDVICTPHNSFNTIEAVGRKSEQSVRQTEHFLREGRFLWGVPAN